MAKSNKAKPTVKVTKTAKPAKVTTEVEITEEARPAGMEAGVAIVTTIALIAAILVVDYSLSGYGAGMFFK
jgi:hypothetical protein